MLRSEREDLNARNGATDEHHARQDSAGIVFIFSTVQVQVVSTVDLYIYNIYHIYLRLSSPVGAAGVRGAQSRAQCNNYRSCALGTSLCSRETPCSKIDNVVIYTSIY